ncbi:ROK family glucokinase [Lederbergia panacisoli]|uniref:ROK family glucokinase n=1 Tax=Lederbergia panacisoli TaxID=1255251 RepID=UPI00214C6705|nr:ROK family glucokinase [Lederbergia panacisoli]MCR2820392.1 ROK family glucokinase [Lederbergia panacisoli]
MENEKWLLGIDIGGTSVKLAFLSEEGDIIHKWEIPTNIANNGSSIISDIGKSVHQKLAELNVPHEKLKAAGVGAPGPIDQEKGVMFEAVNLGWPDNYQLRNLMQEAVGVPVAIENDANSAALGEMWKGAGKGAKDLIAITLGTGVGGGVIVNGDIVHGAKGAAGEVGHITAVPEGGYMCNCGKTGCLETVASATGIVRTAKALLAEYEGDTKLNKNGDFTAKDIFDAAQADDELALITVDSLANHLGLALANIGSTFNPEKIVIGGGVSKAGDFLIGKIGQYFKKYAFKPVGESTDIVLAQLGNDAGIAGAAWLAANKN